MTKVQGFKAPDGTEMVVLPRADYDALREAAEDVADAAAAARAEERLAAGEDELIPWEMSKRLSGGENPINVWRKHRGLTISGLAELAGISQPYLSEIEAGKREGTIKTLAALARALRLPLDDLVSVERSSEVRGFGSGSVVDVEGGKPSRKGRVQWRRGKARTFATQSEALKVARDEASRKGRSLHVLPEGTGWAVRSERLPRAAVSGVFVHGRDGRIRESLVTAGRDPMPPRDQKKGSGGGQAQQPKRRRES